MGLRELIGASLYCLLGRKRLPADLLLEQELEADIELDDEGAEPDDGAPVVRYAQPADIPELVRLERSTPQEDLWDAVDFQKVLTMRSIKVLVVARRPQLLAYAAVQTHRQANLVLSLVVHKDWQRKGVGSGLLACVLALEGKRHRALTMARVRESNLGGQLFLKANGFLCTALIEEAYEAPPESALHFERLIDDDD